MSDSQREIEALRALWPASERLSDTEVRSLADQIREKDRSIRASTQAGSRNGLIAAFAMAIIAIGAASRARWVSAQIGFALCAVGYIAAVCVLTSYRRRDRATPALDLDTRGYYDELIKLHEREIRFLKSAKYWYLSPVLIGVALIGGGCGLKRQTG
jgi:hypothetical protein